MEEYIPAIQDVLRRQGFPLHHQQAQQILTVSNAGMSSRTITQWGFIDKDRRNGVMINETILALETTQYTTFLDFHARLEIALKAVQTTVGGDMVVERIGLRYVNTIQPRDNQAYASLLHPALAGPIETFLSFQNAAYQAEIRGQVEAGGVIVRSAPGNLGNILPPDLNTTLTLESKVDVTRPYQYLDVDHYDLSQYEFDAAVLSRKFVAMHETTAAAFKEAVTQDAYEAWLTGNS